MHYPQCNSAVLIVLCIQMFEYSGYLNDFVKRYLRFFNYGHVTRLGFSLNHTRNIRYERDSIKYEIIRIFGTSFPSRGGTRTHAAGHRRAHRRARAAALAFAGGSRQRSAPGAAWAHRDPVRRSSNGSTWTAVTPSVSRVAAVVMASHRCGSSEQALLGPQQL